jgi:Phospholipase_D-nuclease N-terminal
MNVPQAKLGRWIACSKCGMEFAALAEEPDQEENQSVPVDDDKSNESGRRTPMLGWALAGSLCLVALVVSLIAFAASRQSSAGPGDQARRPTTVPSSQMPPVGHSAESSPLDLLGQGNPISSGISAIQDMIWWTKVLTIPYLISAVLMLLWMAKDSRNRGMESIASWITAILFFHVLGFLVYLIARPKGRLAACRHCRNRCLEFALCCPHCKRKLPLKKRGKLSR